MTKSNVVLAVDLHVIHCPLELLLRFAVEVEVVLVEPTKMEESEDVNMIRLKNIIVMLTSCKSLAKADHGLDIIWKQSIGFPSIHVNIIGIIGFAIHRGIVCRGSLLQFFVRKVLVYRPKFPGGGILPGEICLTSLHMKSMV